MRPGDWPPRTGSGSGRRGAGGCSPEVLCGSRRARVCQRRPCRRPGRRLPPRLPTRWEGPAGWGRLAWDPPRRRAPPPLRGGICRPRRRLGWRSWCSAWRGCCGSRAASSAQLWLRAMTTPRSKLSLPWCARRSLPPLGRCSRGRLGSPFSRGLPRGGDPGPTDGTRAAGPGFGRCGPRPGRPAEPDRGA